MKIICAWCQKPLGSSAVPFEPTLISHGICDSCAAKWREQTAEPERDGDSKRFVDRACWILVLCLTLLALGLALWWRGGL